MLLLILIAVCLASCAAQTEPLPSSRPTALTDSIQATSVVSAVDSRDNAVAFLLTVVQSYSELNETTIGPVLHQLYNMIQLLQPDLNFSLTLKNITRV